jgi:hypothetical protein
VQITLNGLGLGSETSFLAQVFPPGRFWLKIIKHLVEQTTDFAIFSVGSRLLSPVQAAE